MEEITVYTTKNSVLETLGIEITEYTPERVVATMPVTPKPINHLEFYMVEFQW